MPLSNPIQSHGGDESRTLIDQLLTEQRSTTAAVQFSRWHEKHTVSEPVRQYRSLIPLTAPKSGEQYAFDVDLDRCSGCKACVAGCHNLNGLDENETWRSVGSLHGGTRAAPLQLTVTTSCHHCVEPGCLDGCPVLAYEKDSVTGIVSHIADRCIGCQYCTLKCPYTVPQFQKSRGIVRKCDMCSDRLAHGEAPACVQACPSEAIRITVVNKQQLVETTTSSTQLVPGAPASDCTLPTTRYRSSHSLTAKIVPADQDEIKAEAAHLPLAIMLVLTQVSVGIVWASFFAGDKIQIAKWAALLFVNAGLAASIFHLGKPLRAWRALANLRKSWLSREIAAFSSFAGLASADAVLPNSFLHGLVAVAGLVAVFTSVMIYVDTNRPLWSFRITAAKFFGSTLMLGLACSVTFSNTPRTLLISLILVSALKLALETRAFRVLDTEDVSLEMKSAQLLAGILRPLTVARFICGFLGGILLPILLLVSGYSSVLVAVTVFMFCLAGELVERHLFFVAAVAPKMPGGVAT